MARSSSRCRTTAAASTQATTRRSPRNTTRRKCALLRGSARRAAVLTRAALQLSKFSDLESLASFGFRGEALSSLCSLCQLSVVTRTHQQARRRRPAPAAFAGTSANTLACARGSSAPSLTSVLLLLRPGGGNAHRVRPRRSHHKHGVCAASCRHHSRSEGLVQDAASAPQGELLTTLLPVQC